MGHVEVVMDGWMDGGVLRWDEDGVVIGECGGLIDG